MSTTNGRNAQFAIVALRISPTEPIVTMFPACMILLCCVTMVLVTYLIADEVYSHVRPTDQISADVLPTKEVAFIDASFPELLHRMMLLVRGALGGD